MRAGVRECGRVGVEVRGQACVCLCFDRVSVPSIRLHNDTVWFICTRRASSHSTDLRLHEAAPATFLPTMFFHINDDVHD